MGKAEILEAKSGRKLAYHRTDGQGPMVVFLGGLKSDMMGTKAVFLENWAKQTGRAYLRFDYSGHGESSQEFTDGCIGDWAQDTRDVIAGLTDGPVVLVGSSMGGWQALLMARADPEAIAGLVTIAAAPDFTEDGYWANFTQAQRRQIEAGQTVELASDYMEPYLITPRMIADGRKHLILRTPLHLPFPTRFLQGTADSAVSVATAVRLLEHATGPDMQLRLVKDADHRFSDGPCLDLILKAIDEVSDVGR